jgi:hypothetical protein
MTPASCKKLVIGERVELMSGAQANVDRVVETGARSMQVRVRFDSGKRTWKRHTQVRGRVITESSMPANPITGKPWNREQQDDFLVFERASHPIKKSERKEDKPMEKDRGAEERKEGEGQGEGEKKPADEGGASREEPKPE